MSVFSDAARARWRARAAAVVTGAAAAVLILGGVTAPPASASAGSSAVFPDPGGTLTTYGPGAAPTPLGPTGLTTSTASVATVRTPLARYAFVVDTSGALTVVCPAGAAAPLTPPGSAAPGQPVFAAPVGGWMAVGYIDDRGFLRLHWFPSGEISNPDVNDPCDTQKDIARTARTGAALTPALTPPSWSASPPTPLAWHLPGARFAAVGTSAGQLGVFTYAADGTPHALWAAPGTAAIDRVLGPAGWVSPGSGPAAAITASGAISLFVVRPDTSISLLHPAIGGGLATAPVPTPFPASFQTTAGGRLAAATDGTGTSAAYVTKDGAVALLRVDSAGNWSGEGLETPSGAGWAGASVGVAETATQTDIYLGSASAGQPCRVTVTTGSSGLIPSGPSGMMNASTQIAAS